MNPAVCANCAPFGCDGRYCASFKLVTTALGTKVLTIPGNGSYLPGRDFRPGTYRAYNSGRFCIWERARDATGNPSSRIGDGHGRRMAIVAVVKASDKVFKTAGCDYWKRTGNPALAPKLSPKWWPQAPD